MDVSVVVATRNRREQLTAALERLRALPEQPPVIVVDNASTDGTVAMVRRDYPEVEVVPLDRNAGAAGRNAGVARARTPYVAFCDDDSTWEPGALGRAAAVLDAHAELAVVAARVLVGPQRRVDETCTAMRTSPLPWAGAGPGVLGFVACGAVVRREAFLSVGGFEELLVIMGEEELLALDLAAAGWRLAYVDDVVAVHFPEIASDRAGRDERQLRNGLLTALMRRPAPVIARRLTRLARLALRERAARRALAEAVVRAPTALARRQVVPPPIEAQARLVC